MSEPVPELRQGAAVDANKSKDAAPRLPILAHELNRGDREHGAIGSSEHHARGSNARMANPRPICRAAICRAAICRGQLLGAFGWPSRRLGGVGGEVAGGVECTPISCGVGRAVRGGWAPSAQVEDEVDEMSRDDGGGRDPVEIDHLLPTQHEHSELGLRRHLRHRA